MFQGKSPDQGAKAASEATLQEAAAPTDAVDRGALRRTAMQSAASPAATQTSDPSPGGEGPQTQQADPKSYERLRNAIRRSPHRAELESWEKKLDAAKSAQEAREALGQIRGILTGATGTQGIEEFSKGGFAKAMEELKRAGEEVKASYGFSIGRPSTLVPFLRTAEQDKAVQDWVKASAKALEYIKSHRGQLSYETYHTALEMATAETLRGTRFICDLTTDEQKMAQEGQAVSGAVLAVSGTALAGIAAFYAARSRNPEAIAGAAGFAAMNLEHDRFIKDIALTAKSWDEYTQMYSDGLADATKKAATTGLIVAAATWTILRLKEGSLPVGSLTPTILNQISGAIAASLEVTFGTQLAHGALENVIQGASDIYQGLTSGNTEQARRGLRAIGDAGLDVAQLAALGKLIEGWTGRKTSAPGRPVGKEPEVHEQELPKRPGYHQKFVDAKTTPEIIPANTIPENTKVENVKFPDSGSVKARQEIKTEADVKALAEFCGIAPDTIPKGTKGKVKLINHDYANPDHPANFKIEVQIGGNEFTVGFDPKHPPGRPDFTGNGRMFPEGTRIMDKATYNEVCKEGVTEFNGFRKNADGIIEKKSPDGTWEPFMNAHYPYGTQK